MTNSQLIENLKKYPPEMEVAVLDEDRGAYKIDKIEISKMYKKRANFYKLPDEPDYSIRSVSGEEMEEVDLILICSGVTNRYRNLIIDD